MRMSIARKAGAAVAVAAVLGMAVIAPAEAYSGNCSV